MFSFLVLIPAFITVIFLGESPFTHSLAPQSPCWSIQQGLPEQEETYSNHWIQSKTQYCVYIGNLKRQASWFKLKGVFQKLHLWGLRKYLSQWSACLARFGSGSELDPPECILKKLDVVCCLLLVFSAMGKCRQATACSPLVSQLRLLGEL